MGVLTEIANNEDLCGECPVWDPQARCLYWTDITGKRVWRYHWSTAEVTLIQSEIEVCGLVRNKSGGFVVTNSAGFHLWNIGELPRLLVADVDGVPCQLNDCIADADGRVLAGSQFYNPNGDYPLGHLFVLDARGQARVLDEGFHLANGLAWSLDGKTFYLTDSIARRIYAYDYDLEQGAVRNRRVLVQVPRTEGIPDGLTTDSEGFLWSAQWYGSCVMRYDPEGKAVVRVGTPAKQTSSVIFGGPSLDELYITTAKKPEPGPVPPGYDPNAGYVGGRLYRADPQVCGVPGYQSNMQFAP